MAYRFLAVLFLLLNISPVLGQDAAPSPDYFVEALVDNPTPYVGQQTWYRVRLYDAVGLENPQYAPPDFEGLWRAKDEFVGQFVQDIGGRQYTVTEIVTALYPTRLGDVLIPAATVLLAETVHRLPEQLKTDAVTIQAQPLPENAPADFGGGVGQFELSASIDRQSATLGDPLVLRLTLRGTGNVEQLPLPEIPFPEVWLIVGQVSTYDSSWVDGRVIGEKVYEYSLSPTEPGTHSLPAINLSFFDPDNGLYRSITTAPITLDILPPPDSPPPPVTSNERPANVLPLKPVLLDAGAGDVFPGVAVWVLWLLPPIALAGCWAWLSYKRQRQQSAAQSRALLRSLHQLQSAAKSSSESAFVAVQKAIMSYLSHKLHRSVVGMSSDDIAKLMKAVKVPQSLPDQLLTCLDMAYHGEYAPQSTVDSKSLLQRTSQILQELDKAWK